MNRIRREDRKRLKRELRAERKALRALRPKSNNLIQFVMINLGIIDRLLAPLIDKAKLKNPKLWAVIAGILTILKFGINDEGLFSLVWILEKANVAAETANTITEWATWIIALIIGSKSAAYLSDEAREARIAESNAVVENLKKT